MTREEIIAQVNSMLAEEFEIEESEFTPEASLKETLQLDSINLTSTITSSSIWRSNDTTIHPSRKLFQ